MSADRGDEDVCQAARRQVVGAAVIRDVDGIRQLLAARRTEPPVLAGRWELPGGKVEPGETLVEALRRELDEELALAGEVGDVVPGPLSGTWPLGDRYALSVFVVRVDPCVVIEPRQQHDELRWVSAADWDSVDWLPDDVPPVRAVLAVLDVG